MQFIKGMNVTKAPRTAINASCSDFKELDENGKNTLAVGGGGLWWKKETVGKHILLEQNKL